MNVKVTLACVFCAFFSAHAEFPSLREGVQTLSNNYQNFTFECGNTAFGMYFMDLKPNGRIDADAMPAVSLMSATEDWDETDFFTFGPVEFVPGKDSQMLFYLEPCTTTLPANEVQPCAASEGNITLTGAYVTTFGKKRCIPCFNKKPIGVESTCRLATEYVGSWVYSFLASGVDQELFNGNYKVFSPGNSAEELRLALLDLFLIGPFAAKQWLSNFNV